MSCDSVKGPEGLTEPVTVTLEIRASAVREASCEVTAKPMHTSLAMTMVCGFAVSALAGCRVQITPSGEWYAENVSPSRTSLTQYGAAKPAVSELDESWNVLLRLTKAMPLLGVTQQNACWESVSSATVKRRSGRIVAADFAGSRSISRVVAATGPTTQNGLKREAPA